MCKLQFFHKFSATFRHDSWYVKIAEHNFFFFRYFFDALLGFVWIPGNICYYYCCYILWKIGNTITIVATYTYTHMSCVLHTAQFLHTLTCSCGLARFSGSVSLWEKWLNNMRWWQYMASENQKSLKISWANGHLLWKDKKIEFTFKTIYAGI